MSRETSEPCSCPPGPRACDTGQARASDSAMPPIHDAECLLGGSRIALIRLGASVYQLRITRQGKLILTK
ncbi:MAG: hemin uptake protein HemP [Gemmobacter sp.]